MGPEPGKQRVQLFENIDSVSWFLGQDNNLSEGSEAFTSCSAIYISPAFCEGYFTACLIDWGNLRLPSL